MEKIVFIKFTEKEAKELRHLVEEKKDPIACTARRFQEDIIAKEALKLYEGISKKLNGAIGIASQTNLYE